VDLRQQLADLRAELADLRQQTTHPTYRGWAWEHRHNHEARIHNLECEEAELVERITALDTAATILASGTPILYAIAHITSAVTTAA
jgi:hypothetical protein